MPTATTLCPLAAGAWAGLLRQRGGRFSHTADKGKVSVRYANGQVRTRQRTLLVTSDPKPGPGSEVTVPMRDTTQHTNYVHLVGGIAQIIASTIAIIVVARKEG